MNFIVFLIFEFSCDFKEYEKNTASNPIEITPMPSKGTVRSYMAPDKNQAKAEIPSDGTYFSKAIASAASVAVKTEAAVKKAKNTQAKINLNFSLGFANISSAFTPQKYRKFQA